MSDCKPDREGVSPLDGWMVQSRLRLYAEPTLGSYSSDGKSDSFLRIGSFEHFVSLNRLFLFIVRHLLYFRPNAICELGVFVITNHRAYCNLI